MKHWLTGSHGAAHESDGRACGGETEGPQGRSLEGSATTWCLNVFFFLNSDSIWIYMDYMIIHIYVYIYTYIYIYMHTYI